MLASEQTNSSPVKKNSPFMETVQDKLKDIKNFSNWSAKEQMIAVGAVGVMVGALLPFVAVALPVAATGAIVALTLFFAVKAVEYTFKGLKWSAEKTVDGAKYTAEKVKDASTYAAGKVRDGAVHVRDSVKEAVSSVGRATREGTGTTLGKMGRSLSKLSESMSSLNAIPYSIGNEGQTVVLKTEEKTRNFNSVKEMFIKEVLEDKAVDNSVLIKKIFSELKGKILEKAYSVDGQSGFKKDKLIGQLQQQVDFVNKLDAKKLQNLLSKDNNNLYEIFSDHHDEIKEVIAKCKEDHILKGSLKMRSNMFEEGSAKPSRSLSFSSLGRKGSEQSNSLSKSSSLDSVRTDSTEPPIKVGNSTFYVAPLKLPRSNSLNSIGTESTATVSDSDSQNFATVRRSNSSSSLTPKLTPVAPPELPRSVSLTNFGGESEQSSSKDELHAAIEKNLREFSSSTKAEFTHSSSSNHDGFDSGFNSPTSSPVHGLFTNKDGKVKTQADLNKTDHNLWERRPSSVTAEANIEHQAPKMKV